MPLVQWLLNLEPIQSVSVKPSEGKGRDLLEVPLMTVDNVIEVPSTVIGADVIEVPRLQLGAATGTSSVIPRPSVAPSITTTKPAGPAVVTSSKSLSSSSMTSKSIAGKPSIRRRS